MILRLVYAKHHIMTDKEKTDEKKDAPIQPDPETLEPNPQEKMKGPVSSIIREIAEEGDEKDMEEEKKEKDKE